MASPAVQPEDLQSIRTQGVITLVDNVQKVSTSTLVGAVQLLASTPAFLGSSAVAVAVLASILLRRVSDRRVPSNGLSHHLQALGTTSNRQNSAPVEYERRSAVPC